MKVLEKIHKIDDIYLLSIVALGLAILLIYFISTLAAFRAEIQGLRDQIHTLESKQKEIITQSINDGLSSVISDKMREEFTYDRQNFKLVNE